MKAVVNDSLDKGLTGTDEQARLGAYLRASGKLAERAYSKARMP